MRRYTPQGCNVHESSVCSVKADIQDMQRVFFSETRVHETSPGGTPTTPGFEVELLLNLG
jgi:hypothetical protein